MMTALAITAASTTNLKPTKKTISGRGNTTDETFSRGTVHSSNNLNQWKIDANHVD